MSVASVWGWVVVFSDGSGYVFFRGGGVAVYSIDGRLMYASGLAYLGSVCLVLGVGSGVSVTFCKGLCVFYPLNFTPMLVGAAVVAVKSRRVHLSGEEFPLFSGGSAFWFGVF
ncbi:MAG: hypothetical protein ACO2PN_04090 [Pyrobaculum sp.]